MSEFFSLASNYSLSPIIPILFCSIECIKDLTTNFECILWSNDSIVNVQCVF